MKNLSVLISSFILFHTVVHCQSTFREIPPQKMSLGIETAFPIGTMSLTHSFCTGISMKTVTPITSYCGFTLSGGAIKYFNKHNIDNKEKVKLICFPIKAGISLFS